MVYIVGLLSLAYFLLLLQTYSTLLFTTLVFANDMCMCAHLYAVTAVDSGTKALELLGLNENENCDSHHHHHNHVHFDFLS